MKGKNRGSDEQKSIQTETKINKFKQHLQYMYSRYVKKGVVGINLQCTCIKKNTAHYINKLLTIGQEIFAVENFRG